MEYFKLRRAKKNAALAEKAQAKGEEPVLTDDDQQFLHKIMSSGEDPPPLPARPQDLQEAGSTNTNNAQLAIIKDAQNVALPETPTEPVKSPGAESSAPRDAEASKEKDKSKVKEKVADSKVGSRLSGFFRSASVRRSRDKTAADLHSAAEALKSPTSPPAGKDVAKADESDEKKKEEEEIAEVLDQLNLAAQNNRVFSISDESKDLLKKFNLVLKDLINGVPTAYHDLESLLTNSEDQLTKIYESMPSFLKHLVEKLPGRISEKFTEAGGPELLATAAAKASTSSAAAAEAASSPPLKVRVPSLKELVTKQGAIASLLRGITQFLRTRFPAALGVNVLWSMALFVLLLIFWYCHKRGREVRLENERKVTAEEMEALRQKVAAEEPGTYDAGAEGGAAESMALTTTAPAGASLEEVHAGVREVQEARRASAAAAAAAAGSNTEGAQSNTSATTSGTQPYAEGGSLAQAVREGEVKEDGGAAATTGKDDGKAKTAAGETAPGSS